MRHAIVVAMLPALIAAQGSEIVSSKYHKHDGFYLSMSLGPTAGNIELDADNTFFSGLIFSGAGSTFDFKIGGVICKNTILSFDAINRTIVGPTYELDSVGGATLAGPTSDNVRATDFSFGAGITYYFMPVNIFINGTVGFGVFSAHFDNGINKWGSTSEGGLSLHLKVGKEWWVSKNWGLGVSGGFGFVAAKDKTENSSYPSYSGDVTTSKVFILFNTTYN